MAGETAIHLERMHHDVVAETTEIWCDANWMLQRNVTDDVDQCTCLTCLEEVRDFAKLAHKRWNVLVRTMSRSIDPPP